MPRPATSSRCIGILLAAGSGSRFQAAWTAERQDDAPHKLLARLPDGLAVAEASARALCAALPTVVAVTAPGRPELAQRLAAAGCEVVLHPEAHTGMGGSLAAAIGHIAGQPRDWDACLVALADMPWVRADTHRRIADAGQADTPIVAPWHAGRRGHPVRFSRALWPALAALQGDAGARQLLRDRPVLAVDCDDPGVLRDIDLPADLTPSA